MGNYEQPTFSFDWTNFWFDWSYQKIPKIPKISEIFIVDTTENN